MNKTAYLTVDDGVNINTPAKMDFLEKEGVPAIFFLRGDSLASHMEIAVEAASRGFILGNHAFDHPYFSAITPDEAKDQITRTDELLEEVFNRAGVSQPFKLFRFPHGDKGWGDDPNAPNFSKVEYKNNLQNLLRSLGYSQPKYEGLNHPFYSTKLLADVDMYWTYDTMDYTISRPKKYPHATPEGLWQRMDESPELAQPNTSHIILAHDFVELYDVFCEEVTQLKNRGFKFKLLE